MTRKVYGIVTVGWDVSEKYRRKYEDTLYDTKEEAIERLFQIVESEMIRSNMDLSDYADGIEFRKRQFDCQGYVYVSDIETMDIDPQTVIHLRIDEYELDNSGD